MKLRIKICCISSLEEAPMAVVYGADALGLVSEMPSGPGVVSDELAREIPLSVPPAVATFLLTSKQSASGIVKQQRFVRSNTLQIVDRLTAGTYQDLCDALPGIALVQVIHVQDKDSFAEAVRIVPEVDALLLDSGDQRLAVKLLGGTGRTRLDNQPPHRRSGSKTRFSSGRLEGGKRTRGSSSSSTVRAGYLQRRADRRKTR